MGRYDRFRKLRSSGIVSYSVVLLNGNIFFMGLYGIFVFLDTSRVNDGKIVFLKRGTAIFFYGTGIGTLFFFWQSGINGNEGTMLTVMMRR